MIRELLAPLSFVYGRGVSLRRTLYENHLLKSHRISKPVISVGNLTLGGTGKTPFINALLSQLDSKGINACILTRGYGRKSNRMETVSETSSSGNVGDEPLWLYKKHPKARVVVSAQRAKAASFVNDADVFILDDGLQHLAIARDLEITLIDATRPHWHYRVLPLGYAREDFKVLRSADIIVITRANQVSEDKLSELKSRILESQAPGAFLEIIESQVLMSGCQTLHDGSDVLLEGKKVFLVSGIGNPESFEKLLKDSVTGLEVLGHEMYRDHSKYTAQDLTYITQLALKKGVNFILTTEKDAIKLGEVIANQGFTPQVPLAVVTTRLVFQPELPDLYDLACFNRA